MIVTGGSFSPWIKGLRCCLVVQALIKHWSYWKSPTTPTIMPFKKLAHPVHCGGMVERIMNMPDWAIFAATTFEDTVGNVTLDEQFATAQLLIDRRGFLTDLVQRVLL